MLKRIFKSRMLAVYAVIVFGFIALGACGHFVLSDAHVGNNRQDNDQQYAATDKTFYQLPSIMVDVNDDDRTSHVQFDVSLEIPRKDRRVLIGFQPRIIDSLNVYLSRSNADELKHQDTLARMRREMLRQVNDVGAPVIVSDLIFQEIIVM